LGQRRYLEPELAEPRLREIIDEYPVGYIVVHTDAIEKYTSKATVVEVLGWLNSLPDLLCPVWGEGSAVVYRTSWHPDGCPARTPPEIEPGLYQIDIGSNGRPFIGWGWHYPEDVGGLSVRWLGKFPQTDLYVDLPSGAYEITVAAQAFFRDRALQLLINGESVETVAVPAEHMAELMFDVPAELIDAGQNLTVTLDYGEPDSPDELGMGDDERELALMIDWIRFRRVD
jgi:hypothetical protein